MFGKKLFVIHHHLQNTGGKNLDIIGILSQILLENTAEDTVLHKIICQRHNFVYGLPHLLCQISDGAFGAQPCRESEICFII